MTTEDFTTQEMVETTTEEQQTTVTMTTDTTVTTETTYTTKTMETMETTETAEIAETTEATETTETTETTMVAVESEEKSVELIPVKGVELSVRTVLSFSPQEGVSSHSHSHHGEFTRTVFSSHHQTPGKTSRAKCCC